MNYLQRLGRVDERGGASYGFRKLIDAIVQVHLSNDRLARRQIYISSNKQVIGLTCAP
jgi:hypothetical protein